MEILQQLNRLKTELDASRPLPADLERQVMQRFRMDWNYHSNHLEGNTLTYGETRALILFGITAQGKPLQDHIEMAGHNAAVKWIEEVVKEDRPLTESFIRQLHKLILKEPYEKKALTPDGRPTTRTIRVGEYKRTPNHVLTQTGEVFHFASPEETPALMHELIGWYREERKKEKLEPIWLATRFHYDFIRIHPFDDGNGRTARLLMNMILMQYGYPPVVIPTEEKHAYSAVLRQADAGILEPFVTFIARQLQRSLELMLQVIAEKRVPESEDLKKEQNALEEKLNGDE
jgi:Fic family protein